MILEFNERHFSTHGDHQIVDDVCGTADCSTTLCVAVPNKYEIKFTNTRTVEYYFCVRWLYVHTAVALENKHPLGLIWL